MSAYFHALPRERCLTMRLYYNPENPPPADFKLCPDFMHTEDRLSWPAQPTCFPMGTDYLTPYHSVDLRIKTLTHEVDTIPENATYLEPENILEDDAMWRTTDDDAEVTTSDSSDEDVCESFFAFSVTLQTHMPFLLSTCTRTP